MLARVKLPPSEQHRLQASESRTPRWTHCRFLCACCSPSRLDWILHAETSKSSALPWPDQPGNFASSAAQLEVQYRCAIHTGPVWFPSPRRPGEAYAVEGVLRGLPPPPLPLSARTLGRVAGSRCSPRHHRRRSVTQPSAAGLDKALPFLPPPCVWSAPPVPWCSGCSCPGRSHRISLHCQVPSQLAGAPPKARRAKGQHLLRTIRRSDFPTQMAK
mmetsp:Transcript_92495/g.220116  ORF Transcript_92495/g.220116 Transcript_92495/m.220116 type:complete len:216 (+) Transcript_92495:209-856(+)